MRRYAISVIAAFATVLGTVAVLNLLLDPYWVWRESPIWTKAGLGYHPSLETRMRMVKALQVVTYQPDIVLLGSSRVQVGLDPAVFTTARAYNLGITGLHMIEAEAYARHVINFTGAREIVFGLDFFAFNASQQTRPEFDSETGSIDALFRFVGIALFGFDTLRESIGLMVNHSKVGQNLPLNTRAGFTHFPPRSPEAINRLSNVMASRTYYDFSLSQEAYRALARTIRYAKENGIKIHLFVSPIHQEQFRLIERLGLLDKYREWEAVLMQIAEDHHVSVWNFPQVNSLADIDISGGGNGYYLDASHYSPIVGTAMLRDIGFAVANSPTARDTKREPTEVTGLIERFTTEAAKLGAPD